MGTNRKILITSVMMAAGISSGCGSFSSKKAGKKLEENDRQLAGEWQGGCVKQDWFGFSFQRQKFNFSSIGDFDRTTTIYSDTACEKSVSSLQEHGTYAVLGNTPSIEGARDINLTISSASVKPETSESSDSYNLKKYCGFDNWQKDQLKDILGKECAGVNHPNGEVIFDIYRIENDQKELKTGKGSIFFSSEGASSRPTKLNEDQIYIKK